MLIHKQDGCCITALRPFTRGEVHGKCYAELQNVIVLSPPPPHHTTHTLSNL